MSAGPAHQRLRGGSALAGHTRPEAELGCGAAGGKAAGEEEIEGHGRTLGKRAAQGTGTGRKGGFPIFKRKILTRCKHKFVSNQPKINAPA
jgi:hypothetical protein